jgi:hypothetical protein
MDTYEPNRARSEPEIPEQYDGPFSARGTRILKIAVVVMGIMLIVGFMVVVITIAYRAMKLGEATKTVDPVPIVQGFSRLDVEVEPDTLISQIELDGNRMAVHVTKDSADEILIIDIKSGELLGRVRLLEKAPADP